VANEIGPVGNGTAVMCLFGVKITACAFWVDPNKLAARQPGRHRRWANAVAEQNKPDGPVAHSVRRISRADRGPKGVMQALQCR